VFENRPQKLTLNNFYFLKACPEVRINFRRVPRQEILASAAK
jgi:hypothetical protein